MANANRISGSIEPNRLASSQVKSAACWLMGWNERARCCKPNSAATMATKTARSSLAPDRREMRAIVQASQARSTTGIKWTWSVGPTTVDSQGSAGIDPAVPGRQSPCSYGRGPNAPAVNRNSLRRKTLLWLAASKDDQDEASAFSRTQGGLALRLAASRSHVSRTIDAL